MAVRIGAATGSLWVPSPRAMNAPVNGCPSTVPVTLTRPRVSKSCAESGSWTQVQVSAGLTLPSRAVNVMSRGRGPAVVLLLRSAGRGLSGSARVAVVGVLQVEVGAELAPQHRGVELQCGVLVRHRNRHTQARSSSPPCQVDPASSRNSSLAAGGPGGMAGRAADRGRAAGLECRPGAPAAGQ